MTNLAAAGYDLDIAEELSDCQDMAPERFSKHVEKIKARYSKAPTGMPMLNGLKDIPGSGPGGNGPSRYSKDEVQKAVEIAGRENIPFEQALEKARA